MTAKEFEELALNGHNYPTWAMDIKISLASRGIARTIQPPEAPLPALVQNRAIAPVRKAL